ncbi:HAUS augmin-like complex subunit 5 [Dendronephthya gigantea]|uniref:HAUS augmin-like complex subunit 5 n=1 Tax=Dendronephthya gigantea TaxID=151771 RepID=UPI00106B9680|nr:HAUS augmin-like complex subunit 5 [Dendronephthya gigantea]XP_028401920.1 HAUS augmin-like complex subunit 5 [Dendronephthya gigantea]
MLPSSTKKSARNKKNAFSHNDRDKLSLELRKWALEEMCFRPQGRHVNSRMPNVEEFKTLCRGPMMDVWSHVIKHLRSTQKVQTVKGNLKLYSSLHNKSTFDEVSKKKDIERMDILKRIAELQSQIDQVEKDVYHPEKEILQTEHSLAEVDSKRRDLEKRCVLLSSYSEQFREKAKVLDEFRRRIEGRISHFRDLRRKSSGENTYFVQKSSLTGLLGSGNEQNNSVVGLESACTRNVRETCEAIGSFLHVLHNDYVADQNPSREQNDKTKARLWTSVETILSQHPAADIYGSLKRTALDSANNLQELTSRIDVRKDAKELKFKYENSGQLSDTSSPRPLLLSVHQLIEEGQAAHFQKFISTIKARNELHKAQKLLQDFQQNMENIQKALYGNDPESLSLAQTLCRTELEFVASKATMEFIENEIKELEVLRSTKQDQLDILHGKYRQIQDFEKFVQAKQNMIQMLVKHNSDAKSQLDQRRTEILKYSQDTLCAHECQIKALSTVLCDNVSKDKEITKFASLSLHRLMFSEMDGHGRIPISQLSINRLNFCYPSNEFGVVTSVLGDLDFPSYRAADGLLLKVFETKSKVIETQERLKYNKTVANSLDDMEGISIACDDHVEDLRSAVVQHKNRENEKILPKVQESFSNATKALSECIVAMEAVNSWWEQPGQYLVPWDKVDGMNMRQWKDQWTVMTTRLRQLQSLPQ